MPGTEVPLDPPSSVLAGEAFLSRLYAAYRSGRAQVGSNVFNTTLFIGFDEPGGTYDHVAPGPVAPPDTLSSTGELGFKFDRSGYRVPAVIVSPWVAPSSVFTEEYRHTSLIATLREVWGLGPPFSARDADSADVPTRPVPRGAPRPCHLAEPSGGAGPAISDGARGCW